MRGKGPSGLWNVRAAVGQLRSPLFVEKNRQNLLAGQALAVARIKGLSPISKSRATSD
jgi:hypothetical protein